MFSIHDSLSSSQFVAHSVRMRRLLTGIERLTASSQPVWLVGETGVGKATMARQIHQTSRRAGPFIHVFCGASGLTAKLRSENRVRQAAGGTLFLDDADELSGEFWRFILDDLRMHRCSGRPWGAGTRIVLATSSPVADGFASALLRRERVWQVTIPPLRERAADIRPLAEHFLKRHRNLRPDGHRRFQLTGRSWQRLITYSWRGNVLELENVVKQTLLFSRIYEDNALEVQQFE